MVKQIELPGHTGVYSDEEDKEPGGISRRAVIGGMLGVGAAVAAGVKFTRENKGVMAPQESAPIDQSVSVEEAEANLNRIVFPDLFKEFPESDPALIFDATPQQLRDIVRVPINEYTKTNDGFAAKTGQIMMLMGNAGRTPMDLHKAREEERYPIGERDRLGNSLRPYYSAYVKEQYLDDMVDAFFTYKYDDPKFSGADVSFKNFLLNFANDYENGLVDERWLDKSILIITTEYLRQGPSPANDRSMVIGFEGRRPAINEGGNDVIRRGEMIINVNESADGKYYDLMAQQIKFEHQ